MHLIYFFVGLLTLLLTACDEQALLSAPKKQAVASSSETSSKAEKFFWDIFHEGRYQDIPQADQLLMGAYLQNPNDPKIAADLGFLHIWKITERSREMNLQPTIVNEIILARKYFSDAVEMESKDARYLGYLGASRLVEGKIFNDERQQLMGYFTLKQAIHAWPQFNYFTAGFVMSILPSSSKSFQEALEWQWKTLDLCAQEKVNRNNPDFTPYMKLATDRGPGRACWDSWKAPYNFEGFFLNMGDMLVKSGDPQTAVKIYRNAQLAKNYQTWPYRTILEKRIINAKDNVAPFQKELLGSPDKSILFQSGYGCMVCHQQK